MPKAIVTAAAQKQFNRLPLRQQVLVQNKIDSLERYPNTPGVRAMTGPWKGFKRIRAGNYRIIFSTSGRQTTVVEIDDRKDVYERDVGYMKEVVVKVRRDGSVLAQPFMAQSIGRSLRRARLEADLTQAELARKIRRSQSAVSMAEKGLMRVSPRYVLDVLHACGLPEDWSAHA